MDTGRKLYIKKRKIKEKKPKHRQYYIIPKTNRRFKNSQRFKNFITTKVKGEKNKANRKPAIRQ